MLIDNLSPFFLSVAACPISKEPLAFKNGSIRAPCGFRYDNGDFRVGLDYSKGWAKSQTDYEAWQERHLSRWEGADWYYPYVDSETKEIYDELELGGRVLDVAGAFGLVAQQSALDADTFVSLDAMPVLWKDLGRYKRFTAHYAGCAPLCRAPAFAEFLPIRSCTFDVVHMRSCIDHFSNPLLAVKEAYRVLVPGGRIIIGVSLEGAYRKGPKGLRENLKAFIKRTTVLRMTYEAIFDHHIFHPTRENLRALAEAGGFRVTKEVWAPAYHNVLYLEGTKDHATG